MKIDCSNTVNYLKERRRMCKDIRVCNNCPISSDNNKLPIDCNNLQYEYPEQAIEIVQKWSDEHPIKTRLDDLLEKYPNAEFNADDFPRVCAKHLGYYPIEKCEYPIHNMCKECWNIPV